MNEFEKPKRLYFIDKIRILLTFLVIMHHTMIAYGGSGGWYFVDPNTDELASLLFSIFAALNQGFFMGLFFFISAYFVPGSYDRKGSKNFLKERFIRLGIPILVYIFVINPLMVYFLFGRDYIFYFQSWEGFLIFINGTGPLWFTTALLIFALFYVFWRQTHNESSEKDTVRKPLRNIQIILIIVFMSVFTYLIRFLFPMDGGDVILNIQLGFVVQYIIMLILGVIAFKRDWFLNIPDSQGKLWLGIALVSIIFMLLIAVTAGALEGDTSKLKGGLHWQAFAYAIWESVYAMGMSIGLITLFRKKWNNQGKISKNLSGNAYTIYLIHAPVLVSISVLFVGIIIHPLLKFAIVLSIVLVLCWLISNFIFRRIPGFKRVLG